MRDLGLLTWKEIREINKSKSIVFALLAPIEELGDMLNDNCIDSITDAVIKFYKRDGYEQYGNYFLYKIFPLHIGFLPVFGRVDRKKVTK
jgi:hypothetical protein